MKLVTCIITICFLSSPAHGSALPNFGTIKNSLFGSADTYPHSHIMLHTKNPDEARRCLPGDPPIMATPTGSILLKFPSDYQLQGGMIGAFLMLLFMGILNCFFNGENTYKRV